MKDQYFGDKTDYIKHGVLRAFAKAGLPLGIHWTYTADDTSGDGGRISYLKEVAEYRRHDPPLFDFLARAVASGDRRLKLLEEGKIFPNAVHCFELWTSDRVARSKIIDGLLARLSSPSLIFIDPDNGLSVASARPGKRGAEKYVFPDEVARFWSGGHSVMLYQHFPRVARGPYLAKQFDRLRPALPASNQGVLITSHVAFLLFLQQSHERLGRQTVTEIERLWAPHVKFLWNSPDSSVQEVG